MTKLQKSNYN